MSNCHCNSSINLDGSSQLGRYLKALDPNYAPIDDRSIEDLLLFAKRYAGQIRFYDFPGSNIDDVVKPEKVSWREFFRRDMAVIASSIAVLNITNIKKEYDEVRERLDEDTSQEKFKALFNITLGMAARMDRWYSVAIPENPLRTDLDLAIASHLRWQMKRIMAYEDGYKFIDSKNPLKIDYSGIENDELWGLKDPVDPDATIYKGNNLDDKLRNAALYADDIFNDFYSTLQGLIDKGPDYMAFAMEQYPAHQPHMALFIAFLQIFKLAQEQMNGLTGKMLDFYYKEVLQLTSKGSLPDKAHIIFELAKDISQYDLAAGTILSAGKDPSGKDQLYKTAVDIVTNQAKVKELKTVFIEKEVLPAPETGFAIKKPYARPVANSADGFGKEFKVENPRWPTFGRGKTGELNLNNLCKSIENIKEDLLAVPVAQTGFAIASPQLVLQGGKRLVTLKIPGIDNLTKDRANNRLTSLFEIWLTGEKGWLKVGQVMSNTDKARFTKYFNEGLDIFDPEDTTIETSYYYENESFFVYLPMSETPVIAFDPELHAGYNYITTYPVMQVMINGDMQISEADYKKLNAGNLSLDIRVGSVNPPGDIKKDIEGKLGITIPDFHFDGLKTLVIQNAEGIVAAGNPFNPFTAYPGRGKSFYIGSDEVFNKSPGKLAVNLKRTKDDSALTQKELQNSKNMMLAINASTGNTISPFRVSVLANRNWKRLSDIAGSDFSQKSLAANILNEIKQVNLNERKIVAVNLNRVPLEKTTEWKLQSIKGFIRIDLNMDLPVIDNQTGLQTSQELAPELEIKELSVNYSSSLERLENNIDQFFHVYPFGVVETYIRNTETNEKSLNTIRDTGFNSLDKKKDFLLVNANNLLLPHYTFLNSYGNSLSAQTSETKTAIESYQNQVVLQNLVLTTSGMRQQLQGNDNQYSGELQEEGILFIGLENAVPMQSVSLLLQFAEGSAEDEDNDPPPIHWSYLTNNEWRPMRGEDVVSDGTYGFQTTGIVKLNIPADATSNNTIITKGLHWFSVSVTENANRIPKLINVVAQSVEAVFEDNDNDPKHFDSALPAGSISKLSVKVAEVSKVVQPFASFDGKHKERSKEFYTRVSERLRHKNRAINSWDYEHLVLDRFPSIYKVKCITATDPNCLCREGTDAICCGPQIAPGHVLLIPISNLKNRNSSNPLQPKTNRRVLLEMEAYLKKLTSPFVKVHAKNPVYEQIIVRFRVQFYTGTDKGFYLKQLNDDIVHFLTPWAFDENADVKFGQKIYASSIINFIEERPYVDFITDFVMGVCKDECCSGKKIEDVISEAGNEVSSVSEIPAGIHGCDELEKRIGQDADKKGEIVAIPSTARSILVSVPQHIIIPYTAPEIVTPCQKRKQEKSAAKSEPASPEAESLPILKTAAEASKFSAKRGKAKASGKPKGKNK